MLIVYAALGTIVFLMFNPFAVLKGLKLLDECTRYLGECLSKTSFLLLLASPISACAGIMVYTKKSLAIGAALNYGLLVFAWGGYAAFFYLPVSEGLVLGALYILALLMVLGVVSLINLLVLPFWIMNLRHHASRKKKIY